MALLAFLLELLLLLAIRPGSQLGIPSIGQLLWPVVGLGYDYWGPGYFGDWGNSNAWRLLVRPTTLVAGAAILWPLCMAALPISLRAARVRPILVARAAAFSLTIFSLRAWVGLVWLIICGFIRVLAGKSIYSSNILGIPESPIASFFRFLERCWYYMSYSPWPVLIWLALWWLAALTRGFKLKQGVLAWLAIVVLVHVAMAVMFGVEFRAFGHYYRL
ncbi:MAG: hypothetical protein GC200_04330 [Tepidisphaera sp.]|nr:hypothetical protein [Tepidisphaera sp.]